MDAENVTESCPNCGQSVLRSDRTCWHCGAKLAFSLPEQPASGAGADDSAAADRAALLRIFYFAAMTVFAAAGFLLAVHALGQQPRLATSFALDETTAFTLRAPDGSFSVDLPAGLVWYFPQARYGPNRSASIMAGDARFPAALQPLLSRAPDAELLLLAEAETGILAVARSERLAGISVEDVLAFATDGDFTSGSVESAERGRNFAGNEIAMMLVEQDISPPLMCRQQIQPAENFLYMAALCAPAFDYEREAATFEAILGSLSFGQ
ncbi:MAG: zinc ribbon domain-containing protein [Candidatus Promineifilaceae bacterium]